MDNQVVSWTRRNRLKPASYRCQLTVPFTYIATEQRTVVFVVTNRGAEGWRWTAHVMPTGSGESWYDVDYPANFRTKRAACAAVEDAAVRGFHWTEGEWLPVGATRLKSERPKRCPVCDDAACETKSEECGK